MTGEAERPLAVLAFDHREQAFSAVRRGGMSHEQICDAKELIYDAFRLAADQGLGGARAGVLVDEQFGAAIARRAIADGVAVTMPVERAGETVFVFEYADQFREHLLDFRPVCAKVLVPFRAGAHPQTRADELARLRELSEFLAQESIEFMFELVVGQDEAAEGEVPTVDIDELCASMAELQGAGVRVDVWKVEGLGSHEAAARVVAQAAEPNDGATCIVLGGGASTDVIGRWLDIAAVTPGFTGFAIGRSFWGAAVTAWLDGTTTREAAIQEIADLYRSCTLRYMGAGVS